MISQTNTHLLSLLIIVLSVLQLRTAFSNNLLHSFFHTEAKARVTLYLRDEQDRPVTNAIIVVGYLPVGANNYQRTEYIPDKNGYVTIQEKSIEPIGGYIRAAGFYQSVFSLRDKREHEVKNMIKNHCWLPWDSKKEIVLREVRNPIPMFATFFDKFAMTSGVEFGFDCQKQDWVAPHGNGEVADFVIRFSPHEDSEFDGACHLTFLPLDEAGGFIRKKKIQESAFCSEYDAPINGYQQLVFTKERFYSVYEKNPNDLLEEDYVIFKSRIQRDENGDVIGANYGKIYGPLSYKFSKEANCGMCSFVYYFNPTPNDTNLEFDTNMDKNLFGKGNWVMPHPRKP